MIIKLEIYIYILASIHIREKNPSETKVLINTVVVANDK